MVTGTPAYTPPVTRATFRRSAVAAAVIAVVALVVLVPMGLGLYAVFGAVASCDRARCPFPWRWAWGLGY